MTKIKFIIIRIVILFTLFIFILYPKIIIDSVYESTLLFFNKVFVYLFPFLILSKLFLHFNVLKLFNIKSKKIMVLFLSMITGSPSNSIYIKDLNNENKLNEKEIEDLLICTTNPSISFIISFIGVLLLNNIKYSYIILFSTIISNIIMYLFINKNNNHFYIIDNKRKNTFSKEIKNIILDSIETLIIILGNIVIFNIIIDILYLIINNEIVIAFLSCILELTSGITNLSKLNIQLCLKLPLITFFCLFSSISIHLQIKSILNTFNYLRYLKYRLLICLIGSIICYLTVIIFI